MSLKVHVQNIWPAPDRDAFLGPSMTIVYDAQIALMRSVLGPDAEIRVQYNDRSAYCTNCFSMEACNVGGMLEGLASAEATGCDVALIACGNYAAFPIHGYSHIGEPDVPVVEGFVAATHMAAMLGNMRRAFGLSTSKQRSYKGVAPELAARMLAPWRGGKTRS